LGSGPFRSTSTPKDKTKTVLRLGNIANVNANVLLHERTNLIL